MDVACRGSRPPGGATEWDGPPGSAGRGDNGGPTCGTGTGGTLVRTLTSVWRPVTGTSPDPTGGDAGSPNVNTRNATPPTATSGNPTTADRHPRPLRGNSR